jgi:hypothetical protein
MRYNKYARRRAQLNAISRSYTQKTQKEARTYLELIGIDYEQYCTETGWKGGITRLAHKFMEEKKC